MLSDSKFHLVVDAVSVKAHEIRFAKARLNNCKQTLHRVLNKRTEEGRMTVHVLVNL